MLTSLLQQRQYRVVSTDTVAEALRLAAGQSFEFVVSDLGLPDGSGYDLMKALSQRHGLKASRSAAMEWSRTSPAAATRVFVGHLTKPVTFRTLEKVIEGVYGEVGVLIDVGSLLAATFAREVGASADPTI